MSAVVDARKGSTVKNAAKLSVARRQEGQLVPLDDGSCSVRARVDAAWLEIYACL